MSDYITPEEARELLDKATPGPWEHDGNGCVGNYSTREVVCVSGPDMKNDRQVVADRNLIIAAPDLAELVAGLHYEYAVELKHGDWWITSRHRASTIEAAKEIAARYTRTETRIVRRLVSDPEVVE